MTNKSYYFKTAWQNGSAENYGMTQEEYFYAQVFEDFKENTKNRSLPFFNRNIKRFPQELRSGKMISSENVVALEQNASRYGFTSNMWVYGEDLEKLAKSGIPIKTMKNTKPVLCVTKYQNQNHLSEKEIYISEGGSKTKAQFMYNFDCFDIISQQKILKHLGINMSKLGDSICNENALNFAKNVKSNIQSPNVELEKAKQLMLNHTEVLGQDIRSIITSQMKHMLSNMTNGNPVFNPDDPKVNKEKVYKQCEELIANAYENRVKNFKVGYDFVKCMDNANLYTRKITSESYDLSKAKAFEEQKLVAERINSNPYKKNISQKMER